MIGQAIPKQNFEVIRDQIGAILATELANQHTLDNTFPAIKGVWVERFTPIDAATEIPCVNVTVNRGDYENYNVRKADGNYTYNIDVYTNCTTDSSADSGDVGAMKKMQRIIGVIRAILRHPDYSSNLGLTPGIVAGTNLLRFFVTDKNAAKDSLNDVMGRLQFGVRAIETELTNTPGGSAVSTTKFHLQDTPKGYVFITN